jgi:hypothetical protein
MLFLLLDVLFLKGTALAAWDMPEGSLSYNSTTHATPFSRPE